MKKLFVLLLCLFFWVCTGVGGFALETEAAKMLPIIVAQSSGQANTVILWHDINDDGKADYKATYVFKNGKLHQLTRSQVYQGELGYVFQER